MMAKATQQEKAKRPPFHVEFAEKIIAHLRAGTAPWQKPWQDGTQVMVPHNPASGTVYKGMNRIGLSLSGYEDPRWMTFRQANDMGLRILPGSKATPVVYYQWSQEVDRLDKDGKVIIGADGKSEKVTVPLERPIVRFAHVFNGEQIEGLPPLQLTSTAYTWNPEEKAESILSASGANIRHDQSNRAFYRYGTDTIHLPPKENFPSAGFYYGTALHEIGHWTRHETRLDRENGPFGSELYAREELRAEIASWMLGQDLGIPHDPEQHAAYVASWIKALEEDPYEIVRACRDAEQIKGYIMGLEMKKELEQEHTDNLALDDDRVPKNPATEKTFLIVPYSEKKRAKDAGARWDKDAKLWFAPVGVDLEKLQQWVPAKQPTPMQVLSPQEEFLQTLSASGLNLQGALPTMDGKIHRVPLMDDKPGALNGAYCGYLDGIPAGWVQNYSTGEKNKFVATGHVLTEEQRQAMHQEQIQRKKEREKELNGVQDRAAQYCQEYVAGRSNAPSGHPYLIRKGISAILDKTSSLKVNPFGEDLIVPLTNAGGEIRSIQYIAEDGVKRFQTGAQKQGCFHLLGKGDEGKDFSGEILLAEGYATGASLHLALDKPVAVAFDAGNLEPVAKILREKFPKAQITICADNDHQHTRRTPEGVELWNKGVELAKQAAQGVGGKVMAPIFSEEERVRGLTDFNDLHQSRGLEEVKRQFEGRKREKSKEQGRELSL